ncbi:hypothetical protein [Rhodococcus sp. 27YEA15]|uniref:hypothetical protein n=1 Tax=Rhodococcus sp. 27YEA15 TaxID=3156259 RepID=UPI003C7CC959
MAAAHQSRPWFLRIFGTRRPPPLDRSRSDLEIVASGFDDVESCSSALERAESGEPRWQASAQVVLRHHLDLPAAAVLDAERTVAQDGYARSVTVDVVAGAGDSVRVIFERVQILDALHCSQERSRMAGLAQRLGGSVSGWDALQLPSDGGPSGRRDRRDR